MSKLKHEWLMVIMLLMVVGGLFLLDLSTPDRPPHTYNPEIEYITDIDTVGWKKEWLLVWDSVYAGYGYTVEMLYQHQGFRYERRRDLYECKPNLLCEQWWVRYYDSLWIPILDTTFAPKEPLLVTPEEKKKLLGY